MENWVNLNKMLELSGRDTEKKSTNALKLIELTQQGNKKEIIALLKEGTHPNCYADMTTPLIEAIRADNMELINYFLLVKATINYKPVEDMTDAFWEVLLNKKYDLLRLFVNKKCILSHHHEKGIPLIWATDASDVQAVEILLSHYKINVNERDREGTALHHNVKKSPHTEDDVMIGKMLIAAGADINATNFDGQTPEDLAADFAAKTALMHSRLEQKLPEKENTVEEEPTVETPGIHKTQKGKMKI